MRSQTTQVGNQKGFSLIELMVVVGIIGILAAIAVPNFQRFQAKARQSEAKANLAGLYTAEKGFFAEWNRYFADFRHIGYAPEGTLRYHVGFSSVSPGIPAGSGYSGPGCPNPLNACNGSSTFMSTVNYCPTTAGQPSSCVASVHAVAPTGATVASNGLTFVAQAAGNIDSDPTIDRWTIDQAKQLSNLNNFQDVGM